MSNLLTLPVLLPMLGAALSIVGSRSATLQRVVGIVVLAAVAALAGALLVATDQQGPIVAELGGWPAPVGIALVADRLSALLLLVSTLVTLAVLVYAIDQRIADYGSATASTTFHPMYLMLCAGVSLAYLTGDLFTLFVAFELMLTASYVLITRRTGANRIRAGMTYVTVSLLSSLLFLTAVAMVYAATGTVNLADLAGRVGELPPGLQTVLAMMLLVVFGIKAAIVPLHFWLPDSYPNAPGPVAALFAGLLTKVSFYALLRTQTLIFPREEPWTLMLVLAVATMLVGVLGALAQNDLNRLLSFLLVSHIGFLLYGLAVFDAAGVSGAALYAAHHITVLATLFLVSGLITRRTGTVALDRMGGLLRTSPGLAILFAIPALTLAGVPPTAGFVAKLALLQAGAGSGPAEQAVAGVVVVASLLTLYALVRVWVRVFWGEPQPPVPDSDPTDEVLVGTARTSVPMYAATAGLIAVSLAIAAFAGPLAGMTERAGVDLLDRGPYRAAVLGDGP
ncbi:multisubunit sodium/proton antiporter MrpD subunit [Pseudonocardia hierapolitana]|uniref:Multisubunit sodium/proton antiporter MrpD subunit n=1 Tax=Pseudonocardia hierapolitana TaxID=1128676 RepID=A0A561SWY3_9PSEU|nr:Na+/H+ antiporter subunit D [Pseudonocardia hierapolitana]TWF79373.1 multisubunit sodium/proton antiporter MrpD subunit [Pseudonocardia hierapolitana]